MFLEIRYAASRYVPDVLLEMTSTQRYARVSIADLTSSQAAPLAFAEPSAFRSAVVLITLGSKYLSSVEYLGTYRGSAVVLFLILQL